MGNTFATTIQLSDQRLRHCVQALLATTLVLFALYIYFLSAAVVHVVIREDVEHSLQTLRSDITALESDYIAAQHSVSNRISSFAGFEEITNKVFIDRAAPALVMNN